MLEHPFMDAQEKKGDHKRRPHTRANRWRF